MLPSRSVQGTPPWPDCFHVWFYLIHKRRIRKREEKSTRAKQDLQPVPCWASTDLPQPRAMVTALTGLRHTQTADTSWVLIYSSALCCILFPLLFCLFTIPYNFKSWPMDLAWNLEFAFFPHVYQQLCCDPDNQLSLSSRYSLLCSLLQKTLPCLVQPIYSPSSETPWATKKGVIPVSLAGCEALGEAGSWVPPPWEIRLYKQNLGDFILQRRDRSLEPAVWSLISWEAHKGCLWDLQPRKGNQNVKPDLFLPWLENKLDVGF